MSSQGEIKFWKTPELVEHLLTFLDATSMLNLAQAHRFTVQILQNASVWTKFIKRTCPFGEEEDWPLQDTIVQRKRGQVRLLVGLMELLEDHESHQLKLLELIHQRFPPIDVPQRAGAEERPHGPQYVTLSNSNQNPSPLWVSLPVCSVSPLGFLLLEEVQGSQGLDVGNVKTIVVDPLELEEPLMSVLISRATCQEGLVNWLGIGTVRCNNDQDVVSFSTLVANSHKITWDILEVGDDVGAEGWAVLARAVQTLVQDLDRWLDDGFNVSASRKAMAEGRREDLRSIWEAGVEQIGDNPMDMVGNFWSVKSHGGVHVEFTYGEDWERLEEIMDMTEEDWCTQLEQAMGV